MEGEEEAVNLDELQEIPEEDREKYKGDSYFDRDHYRLRMLIDRLADDPLVIENWPRTSQMLSGLGEALFSVAAQMDRALTYGGEVADQEMAKEIGGALSGAD